LFIPERGWFILTVREDTARRVKDLAKARRLTVDDLISEPMNPSGKSGWSKCSVCGSDAKTKNIHYTLID